MFTPNAARSGDLHHVIVLLPVDQILPLAQRFPDAYLRAAVDTTGQGLPMLRSQRSPEILHFERSVTQQYLAPNSDADYPGSGQDIAPCSPDTAGR